MSQSEELTRLSGAYMMLTYPGLRRNEKMFQSWSGLSVSEFDALYQRFEPAWTQAEAERLQSRPRQRAMGGGGDYTLALDTRLLMLLVWLRLYLTGQTLAYLFGVNQSTVSRNLNRMLPVLYQVAQADLQAPKLPGGRRCLRALEQEQPDLFAIFDATEQSVERPKDDAAARSHFSGKQRRPTCKTTIQVNEDCLIRQITPTWPGSVHDLTHLRQSGLLAQVPLTTILVADSAYIGLHKDLPDHNILVPHKAARGHPLLPDQRLANRELSAIRIKVEDVFAQLKIFRILTHRFRHHVATVHSWIFTIIAALYNRRVRCRLAQTSSTA